MGKDEFFDIPHDLLSEKKFYTPFNPESADWKTLDRLQRAEMHFLPTLFFEILFFWIEKYGSNSVILIL
jgi:hypothetical protein